MSDAVLDALARALRLDDAERAHLHDLARAAGTSPRRRRKPAAPQGVRPNVQRLLDAMTDTPAAVINGRTDVLASNALGRALFASLHDTTTQPPNHARFIYLDARSHAFWDNWDHAADDAVALLHAHAGRNPFDQDLTALIGELSTKHPTNASTVVAGAPCSSRRAKTVGAVSPQLSQLCEPHLQESVICLPVE
ncbi:MmyB family transcriptional regulator [Streptomyces mirabilis]|uniref:MmyB family transcriptional regulator n=1 Tax=Streptomyces mirabilis TaxID=68239 RepID=UPI0036C56289